MSLNFSEVDLVRRRSEFERFLAERMPVLTEFARSLELPRPEYILVEPDRYLDAIDSWMRKQTLEVADRVWIITRLGYYLGEVFVMRHFGLWFLDEEPVSPSFGRYVVGQFVAPIAPIIRIDPFAVADKFINEPIGRSLKDEVAAIELQLAESTSMRQDQG